MESEQKSEALDVLVEEVAMLLEATVRSDEGIFHLTVPITPGSEGEDEDTAEDEEEDGEALLVDVALSVSEDGETLFATRRLCALDDALDLEELLRAVGGTVHVQLSIDEDHDLVLGGAAPVGAGPEWIADVVGEIAEFAPELAEDGGSDEEEDG
jgi:hypothetical protein